MRPFEAISRRSFFAMSLAAFPLLRCSTLPPALRAQTVPARFVRLRTRPPAALPEAAAATGLLRLNLAGDRDGVFYVPAQPAPASGFPLIVLLHGAGGSGSRVITRFVPHAERVGAILVAPDSRESTWNVIRAVGGADAAFIDGALQKIFTSYPVDPRRVSVAGFSDGASYALTLGLTNGDLFSAIAAFSPGFVVIGSEIKGKPPVFISHGTKDDILPIDKCGRKVAATLRQGGYSVDYREFDGKHSLPPVETLTAAVDFLARTASH